MYKLPMNSLVQFEGLEWTTSFLSMGGPPGEYGLTRDGVACKWVYAEVLEKQNPSMVNEYDKRQEARVNAHEAKRKAAKVQKAIARLEANGYTVVGPS